MNTRILTFLRSLGHVNRNVKDNCVIYALNTRRFSLVLYVFRFRKGLK